MPGQTASSKGARHTASTELVARYLLIVERRLYQFAERRLRAEARRDLVKNCDGLLALVKLAKVDPFVDRADTTNLRRDSWLAAPNRLITSS